MRVNFFYKPIFWVLLFLIILTGTLLFFLYGSPLALPKPSFSKHIPGKCLVLEEKYCNQLKIIDHPNNSDAKLIIIDLPKGVPIFAPTTGFYSKSPIFSLKSKANTRYPGVTIITSRDASSKNINAIYSFIFFNMGKQISSSEIKKGEVLGYVSENKIDAIGNYNLAFTVSKQSFIKNKAVVENNREILKDLLGI